MNPAVELLKAAAGGPDRLESYLRINQLTPELATAVRQLFGTFVSKGQLESAELAASVLAVLWLRLGNVHESLRNHIDHLQLRFTRAQSPEEYAEIRTQALDTLGKAVDCQDDEFAFRAAVLAADASYFGHTTGGQGLGLTLPIVLADLVAAAHRAHRAAASPWFPRFVSLFAGILQTTLSGQLPAEEGRHAERSLRQLAGEVPFLRPTAQHFPEDPSRASQIEALLTELVTEYGSRTSELGG